MAGRITGDESLEELQDLVAKLQKDVNWLLEGNLSSKNVREIGGYQVSATLFQSRGGDVGLSSDDDAPDPVRMWAGSTNKDTAPWRVHKSGKGVLTGALIQTSAGYPRIIIDPTGDLLSAELNANDKLSIVPSYLGAPSLLFVGNGFGTGSISGSSLGFDVVTSNKTRLIAEGGIELEPGIAHVLTPSWGKVKNKASGLTLQQEFDNLSTTLMAAINNRIYEAVARALFAANMAFDSGTRNLKLYNAYGDTIATANIPK